MLHSSPQDWHLHWKQGPHECIWDVLADQLREALLAESVVLRGARTSSGTAASTSSAAAAMDGSLMCEGQWLNLKSCLQALRMLEGTLRSIISMRWLRCQARRLQCLKLVQCTALLLHNANLQQSAMCSALKLQQLTHVQADEQPVISCRRFAPAQGSDHEDMPHHKIIFA